MGSTVYSQINREYFKSNTQYAINGYSGIWDFHEAIDIIREREIISSERCDQILRSSSQCVSSRENISELVTFLLETEPLEKILKTLDAVGLSTIADEICRPLDRKVCRTDLPHSRHLQTFYFQLQQIIDNNCVKDRGKYLLDLSTKIKASFKRFSYENDLYKASGRFAVVTCLRIQHCNRNTQLIRSVLRDMCESWPKGVDKTLCDIFFHSKMAIADIMDGEVESAIMENRTAKNLCVPYNDTLTKVLLSHDSRYVHQRVFELNGSEENRRQILFESERGLDYLSSDDNGCDLFNRLMRRMFFLYVVQYRLMIQNDLNTENSIGISQNDLRHAKNALLCFEMTLKHDSNCSNEWEEIYLKYKMGKLADRETFQKAEDTRQIEILDPRTGMIYMVCRARICEETRKFDMAEFVLELANVLTDDGNIYPNESKNIVKFTRGEMIYKVCKARIQEQRENYVKAKHLLSEAMELSKEGAYNVQETTNIREYYNKLFDDARISELERSETDYQDNDSKYLHQRICELTSEENLKEILLLSESGLDHESIEQICEETRNLDMASPLFALLINKTVPESELLNGMMSFHGLMTRVHRSTEF